MPASNATFVGEIGGVRVVYKPVAGERPLWDFPDGTLADREVAAYAVSEALGWDVVPPTIPARRTARPGHGPALAASRRRPGAGRHRRRRRACPTGLRHVFDGLDAHDQPVSLVHEDSAPLRRMALFDVVVNNADRKGGHVLAMPGGHRYGVDHGVTFHVEHKLRTVLWGWVRRAAHRRRARRRRGASAAHSTASWATALAGLLTGDEVATAARRCRPARWRAACSPRPRGGWPAIPWPPF